MDYTFLSLEDLHPDLYRSYQHGGLRKKERRIVGVCLELYILILSAVKAREPKGNDSNNSPEESLKNYLNRLIDCCSTDDQFQLQI